MGEIGRKFYRTAVLCMTAIGLIIPSCGNVQQVQAAPAARQVEALDRGGMALKVSNGVYLSWRYLGTDSKDTAFDIYRDGQKITNTAITQSTNYTDTAGTINSTYEIHTIVNGKETEKSETITVNANNYIDIPLEVPVGGVTPTGGEYTYFPGDASCGDLDGDGEYEIILKWDPSNAGDNGADGYRGNVYIDAYKLDGTKLWRIDLGKNIRAGAHYTQFMVYDFDGDGYAEMVCKTGDGTVDGLGNVIGDANADWRSRAGTILDGPEYLTLFDGFSGKAMDTIPYETARGDVNSWGDDYGNRSERYLAAVAYLNGQTPSVVMCRGYYAKTTLTAYDIIGKRFVKRWNFDSTTSGNAAYAGQGNHNLAVADVDADGLDEIVYGACTIDDDGTGLYSSGLGHGDALHVGDFVPELEGLEIYGCLESSPYGAALRRASDGGIIFRKTADGDTGRAVAGNFRSDISGAEFSSTADGLLYNSKGESVGNWITKWSQNFVVYWDDDLEHEAMDRTMIDDPENGRLLTASGVSYINGSKGTSSLSADLLGDWREEVIWPTYDGQYLRLFHTTFETEHRIATLMHDTQYRCQVASQNVAYNQPPHTSFFLGTGYDLPEQPNVVAAGESLKRGMIAAYDFEKMDAVNLEIPDITGNGNTLKLYGNAVTDENAEKESRVLTLDGKNGTYAEFPCGLFDGLDELTIKMQVKPETVSGNFFTFTVGQDRYQYLFFKTLNESIPVAITTGSWSNEQKVSGSVASCQGTWLDLTLVMTPTSMKLYQDGNLIAENSNLTISVNDLGRNLISYLGRSFYDEDAYFKGSYDNVMIYNYAMTAQEVSDLEANGGLPESEKKVLPFEDVKEEDWFYKAVYDNYFAELMTGKSETIFAPEISLTRAEFASVLYAANSLPGVAYEVIFPDIAEYDWYADAVIWAGKEGIVNGYGSGLFGPADPVAREQMAIMMYNYAVAKGYTTNQRGDLSTFNDASDVSWYAEEAMQWAVGAGVITGKDGGTRLDPYGTTSRAECAAIIYKFMENCA